MSASPQRITGRDVCPMHEDLVLEVRGVKTTLDARLGGIDDRLLNLDRSVAVHIELHKEREKKAFSIDWGKIATWGIILSLCFFLLLILNHAEMLKGTIRP